METLGTGEGFDEFWRLGKYKYLFYRYVVEQYCKRQMVEGHLILDAGCGGRGGTLSEIADGVDVVGIDVNRSNLQKNLNKEGIFEHDMSYVLASLTALPFRDETFDIIVSVDVLEHISTNQKAIAETARVCKVGGNFIGSTSNLLNPLFFFDSYGPKTICRLLEKRFAGEKHYERHTRMPINTLIQNLFSNKLDVIEMKLCGFPPFQPWLYHYKHYNKQAPWYSEVWIIFDKITNTKPFNYLKEMVVFYTIKHA